MLLSEAVMRVVVEFEGVKIMFRRGTIVRNVKPKEINKLELRTRRAVKRL